MSKSRTHAVLVHPCQNEQMLSILCAKRCPVAKGLAAFLWSQHLFRLENKGVPMTPDHVLQCIVSSDHMNPRCY